MGPEDAIRELFFVARRAAEECTRHQDLTGQRLWISQSAAAANYPSTDHPAEARAEKHDERAHDRNRR